MTGSYGKCVYLFFFSFEIALQFHYFSFFPLNPPIDPSLLSFKLFYHKLLLHECKYMNRHRDF